MSKRPPAWENRVPNTQEIAALDRSPSLFRRYRIKRLPANARLASSVTPHRTISPRHHSAMLTSLPANISTLSSLQNRSLGYCHKVSCLPSSLGCVSSLQHLSLSGNLRLLSLPDRFGSLTALRILRLLACETLGSLPVSFGRLGSLQHLSLSGCTALTSLPPGFWMPQQHTASEYGQLYSLD